MGVQTRPPPPIEPRREGSAADFLGYGNGDRVDRDYEGRRGRDNKPNNTKYADCARANPTQVRISYYSAFERAARREEKI